MAQVVRLVGDEDNLKRQLKQKALAAAESGIDRPMEGREADPVVWGEELGRHAKEGGSWVQVCP